MIEVLYAHFPTTLPEQAWSRYFRKMPEDIQKRILRFTRWQDRHAGLLGKMMLLEGLMRHGYPSDCLQNLSYSEYRRPFIRGPVDFNISHSGHYVICAISNKGNVGIDIEQIRDIELADFEDYMTAAQWKAIKESSDPYKIFFEFWTMKESVLKVDGRGLSLPLLDIHIDGGKANVHGVAWYVRRIDVHPSYSCHIATNLENADVRMREFVG